MPSLLIVDGEDEEQVKWAIGKKEDFSGEYMILLTNGSFKTILREYQLRVFRLTDSLQKRFEITHVPCSVIQEGNKIIVSEYEL